MEEKIDFDSWLNIPIRYPTPLGARVSFSLDTLGVRVSVILDTLRARVSSIRDA